MEKKHKRMRRTLQNSDPGKILELVMNLDEDTCAAMQVRINTYLMNECEAENVWILVVHLHRHEAYLEAVGTEVLPRRIKLAVSHKTKVLMKTLKEISELFTELDQDVQEALEPFIPKDNAKRRVVMCPLVDTPFSILVSVLCAKVSMETIATLVSECLLFTWPALKKGIALEYETSLKEKCQQLLKVTKLLFTKVASMETLLSIAMTQAKALTKAEHCCVRLVDVDKMRLDETTTQDNDIRHYPLNKGITGIVIHTGALFNCQNVKLCPDFDPEIDTLPGVECRNLLCFPIREQSGLIGVGLLINKKIDHFFDSKDEEMALSLSIYYGVCIVHSVIYQRIKEAHIRNALANELVMYHMKVSDSEVNKLMTCTNFHNHPHLSSLHFNVRVLAQRELPCYALKMFYDLGFDKKFDLKRSKIANFLLHVKKGYRDVPYHNWGHGFNVAQWAYAAIINFKLIEQGYLSDLQGLMYLIASFVHDLDHRGTTNSFHMNGETTLAALYSSEGSVMERHHLAQAMSILNTEGCDILESLPRREYDRAIIMLRDFILATDLANYFKNQLQYKVIAREFQKNNRAHNAALIALLMNGADLGDQLKDWNCVKKTAAAVLTEFFKQGDQEKNRGELPAAMMDRDKCVIPELEIQFIRNICIPIYEILGGILPKAATGIRIMENHIERWEASKPVFAEVPTTAGLAVLLSPELDNLIEMNLIEMEKERTRKLEEEKERLEAERKAAEEED